MHGATRGYHGLEWAHHKGECEKMEQGEPWGELDVDLVWKEWEDGHTESESPQGRKRKMITAIVVSTLWLFIGVPTMYVMHNRAIDRLVTKG